MSQFSIKQYLAEVEKIIHYGGTKKETAIRTAFYNLLNEYAKAKGLIIVPEVTIKAANGKNITPDGTLKDTLRQDWGYWESKDESDKLDDEIKKKFDKGYPKDNILFEDSKTAVLIQSGYEIMRISMQDVEALDKIILAFIKFERPEVQNFRKAIEYFKEDIPKVTNTLRALIIDNEKSNENFKITCNQFLKLCQTSINPNITNDDIREMIIQHILTEDIFNSIFDETQFHRENNIAHQLEIVIDTFFTGSIKRTALSTVKHYYEAINAAAAAIADHHEKQKFLKVIYETFYKSYNPKAADRLGVVYTPNEVVRFMIESTDYLLHKHFNTLLENKGVEILDPATGTGTFICDLIDYIRKDKLEYKYSEEIHANEVAILPYYISNLNIEYTYKQKTGKYKEFENLCFVDTLDNMGFGFEGKQLDVFSALTEENSKRINKQNKSKISVVIGNPPYNANQMNENDDNKNREYTEIDKRIKDSFIKYSTAQKTKVYDMYARFYRWAFDRLDSNGIIAFITNRSFIDSRTFDGFRKCVQDDFDYAYIIDTKSDVRTNPKISGTGHNIFGIQTGVAIMFLVKKVKKENKTCSIHYISLDDFWRKDVKLQWLAERRFKEIPFELVVPDKKNNWINLTDNDFEGQLLSANVQGKFGRSNKIYKSIFSIVNLGVSTNRDEWSYDFDKNNLINKIIYFTNKYNELIDSKDRSYPDNIKWSNALKVQFNKNKKIDFSKKQTTFSLYRPFCKQYFFANKTFIDALNQGHYELFGNNLDKENKCIVFTSPNSGKPFLCIIANSLFDLHLVGAGAGSQSFPLHYFDKNNEQIDNITDWGLKQFTKQYKTKKITKEDIFHYTYAVLHNPAYRIKYAQNLKRDFPRIPFYEDFFKWAGWGKTLMDLHLNYENALPYLLNEITTNSVEKPMAKLKADKEAGTIALDENTALTGIPPQAWAYQLGNRSALEWVLDQYKEKTPKDPTIASQFNTYRFADYKTQVIDLLKRVTTVSVETMKIINEMENLSKI